MALHMRVMRHLLGHRRLCAICLHERQHESPGCYLTGATLEQHNGYVMWSCVMAPLWLLYGCCYSGCISQERISVCSSYGYLHLLSASARALSTLASVNSAISVNSKTISITKRICNAHTHTYEILFKKMKSYFLEQYGWAWRLLCYVK